MTHSTSRPALLIAAIAAAAGCHADELGQRRAAVTSSLWGAAGEAFDDAGRLMDWSYAGYHAGEDPLPEIAPVTSVVDHGAIADDSGDDSGAFAAALDAAAATGGGAVSVPNGRYVLGARLDLPAGVVLQGESRDGVVLYMPSSLSDLYGAESNWSFSGGFLRAYGPSGRTVLADVTAAAARGSRSLSVSTTAELSVGQWVRIVQTDDAGTLMRRLHADLADGGSDNVGDRGMEFPARITAIAGDAIEIDRALPVDVEVRWTPVVERVDRALAEVGIEHLTLEFPLTTYPGHFNEAGYNGIHLSRVWDSWVRDVRIVNADYGVSVTSSHFVTVTGVVLGESGSRGSRTGHHGLNNGHGTDNLFIDFDIQALFIHDLTNEWYGTGIVFTQGRGVDLCLDHHRAAPYSTLWTELDLGAGTRPWASGGSSNRGPHTAAYDTLWNLRGDVPLAMPPSNYGPRMTFVGFGTDATSADGVDWWLEETDPDAIEPPNLWIAMRERRLGPAPGDADAGVEPTEDAGPGLPVDAGGGPAGADAGNGSSADATGGCSVTVGAKPLPLSLLLVACLWTLRRRSR